MRVLVMRAEADAARTVEALNALGLDAVVAPVIVIAPCITALPPNHPAAFVATSHHAFTGMTPIGIDRIRPVFAVGHQTAEAARAAGFRDVRVGAGGGDDLATLVTLTLPRPGPLLYLAGQDRKTGLEAALATAGYQVEVVEVYAAEPTGRWPGPALDALRDGALDGALHYSRRSASLALALARSHGVFDPFLALRHLCLSADTAAPLIAAGAPSVGVADRPDQGRLLALLQNP